MEEIIELDRKGKREIELWVFDWNMMTAATPMGKATLNLSEFLYKNTKDLEVELKLESQKSEKVSGTIKVSVERTEFDQNLIDEAKEDVMWIVGETKET